MFKGPRYTESELMARLKFTVGLSLAFTLTGIVFVVLYSLIFVTQPMQQSPNDAKFFELIGEDVEDYDYDQLLESSHQTLLRFTC